MQLYLWIALGGALGSVARFAASGLVANHIGETFPWGTLIVNVAGSFLIGLVATLTSPDGRFILGPHQRHFFTTGFCGGFTTFSSFSLQTLALAQDREWFKAGANSVASLACCLLSVWLGFVVATAINNRFRGL